MTLIKHPADTQLITRDKIASNSQNGSLVIREYKTYSFVGESNGSQVFWPKESFTERAASA
jgi:hypothetical protein